MQNKNSKLKDLFFKSLLVLVPAFVFLVFYGSSKESYPLDLQFWFLFLFITILATTFVMRQKISNNFLKISWTFFILGFLIWFIGTQIHGGVICNKVNGKFLKVPFEGIHDMQGEYHSGGTRRFTKPRLCYITLEQSKTINLNTRPYNYIDFVIKN